MFKVGVLVSFYHEETILFRAAPDKMFATGRTESNMKRVGELLTGILRENLRCIWQL